MDFFQNLFSVVSAGFASFKNLPGVVELTGLFSSKKEENSPARQAPNQAAAARQNVKVGGEVTFHNAPAGTTVRNTGSKDVNMSLAGNQ